MGIISTQAFTFRLIANGTQLDLFDDFDTNTPFSDSKECKKPNK